ncbi:zinc finger protein CONSTANS-LIKE 4-like [Andrographis paniculata]|uniref:zinc finger protein CONSTANS-LIKE 4-like n=1 Tax=Andrographis paniculata TaxID=175694 RepID=UPI0021E6FA92|nr:zinc finger protein CONSTANS-LIKE 4-like [Andrographis paniculata]
MGTARHKYFPAPWNVQAKPCDFCATAAAVVFCRDHAVFTCITCDGRAHAAAEDEKHGRVWMCEVCEQAPAAVTCKADDAALCAACDRDIHSANPLAGRHDRLPVVPFFDTAAILVPAVDNIYPDSTPPSDAGRKVDFFSDLPPKFPPADNPEMKSVEFLFSDSEQFFDFDNNYQICSQPYSDSVVPVQPAGKPPLQELTVPNPPPENLFELDFSKPSITSYNKSSYTVPSLSHNLSSSSMEVAVVPDGSGMSEISYPFFKSISTDGQGLPAMAADREARVLRYKEKRKNRKFEKTIRYASRKAYAETRPRIKGRFAKRTDPDPDVDRVLGYGARYGVVPMF